MSRQIDLSKPLTDDEREYLESRGLQAQLDENARLLMGGGAPENTPEENDYESHTIDQLKGFITDRNEGKDAEHKLSTSGNKSDLIATLVADDEANKTEG